MADEKKYPVELTVDDWRRLWAGFDEPYGDEQAARIVRAITSVPGVVATDGADTVRHSA